jgi:lipid-binding SYLF domain-containing protein
MKVTTIFIIFALLSSALIQARTLSEEEPDSSLYRKPKDRKDLVRAYREAEAAARIFNEIMEDPEDSIPPFLLNEAELVAIFPARVRYGIIFEHGAGLVSVRDQQTGKWGAPIFVKIDKIKYKDKCPGNGRDLILIGLNQGITGELLKEDFKLGREVGAEPGPIGKEIDPQPGWSNATGFVAYMRNEESLWGIGISGTKIKPDEDLMETVYGRDTFRDDKVRTFLPASQLISSRLMIFPETLDQYSTRPGV